MTKFHTVQRGDTLSGVGETYGIPWQRVQEANGIEDEDEIYPNQILSIPDTDWSPPLPDRKPTIESFSKIPMPVEEKLPPAQDLPGEPTPISQGEVSGAAYSPEGVPHDEGPSTEGSWFDNTVSFLKDAWKNEAEANKKMAQGLIDTVKFAGQIASGEKATHVLNQETGEIELSPEMLEQGTNLAMMILSGGGAGIKQGAGVGTKPPVVDPQVVRDFVSRTNPTASRSARVQQMDRMFPGSSQTVDPQLMDLILGRGTTQGEFTLGSSITKQGKKPHQTTTLSYDDNTGAFYQAYEMGKNDFLMVNYAARKSSEGGLDIGIAFGRTNTGPAQPAATLKSGTDALSTVVESAREFIKASKPKRVQFTAEDEALDPLYQRFAKQIAKEFGGKVEVHKVNILDDATNDAGGKFGHLYTITFDKFTPWFKGGKGAPTLGSGPTSKEGQAAVISLAEHRARKQMSDSEKFQEAVDKQQGVVPDKTPTAPPVNPLTETPIATDYKGFAESFMDRLRLYGEDSPGARLGGAYIERQMQNFYRNPEEALRVIKETEQNLAHIPEASAHRNGLRWLYQMFEEELYR